MPATCSFSSLLKLAIDYPPVAALAIAIFFSLCILAALTKPHPGVRIVEVLFRSYFFWAVGALYLYRAIAAGIFGADAASAIGADGGEANASAAAASLAFAAIGFLAMTRSTGLRVAAVTATAIYVLAPLVINATTAEVFAQQWGDVLAAVFGAFLLLLQTTVERPPLAAPEPTPMATI